jgi:hypothetical protein
MLGPEPAPRQRPAPGGWLAFRYGQKLFDCGLDNADGQSLNGIPKFSSGSV